MILNVHNFIYNKKEMHHLLHKYCWRFLYSGKKDVRADTDDPRPLKVAQC